MPPRASSKKLRGSALDSIYHFGEDLIKTGDLDPVYIAIVAINLDRRQLSRALVAYWLFYHLGAAAWLSEQGKDFWQMVELAAINTNPPKACGAHQLIERWPRGTERRHFRGDKCISAVRTLARQYPHVEDMVSAVAVCRTASDVIETASQWPMFGSWIGFKVADMLERCAGYSVAFSDEVCLYDEPAAALEILALRERRQPDGIWQDLRKHFSRYKAPPKGGRPCGVQEVETICCKWKSALGGHYWVGKDITEVRHALHGWGDTAQRMLTKMPKVVQEGLFR